MTASASCSIQTGWSWYSPLPMAPPTNLDDLDDWAGAQAPRYTPPALPRRYSEPQAASYAPARTTGTPAPRARPVARQAPDGDLVISLPDVPVLTPGAVLGDPYARFLSGLPDLLPDLSQGVRVGAPQEVSGRIPAERGMSDEDFRRYVVERYGPENAGLVGSPIEKFRPGSATNEEKRAWFGPPGGSDG